MVEKLMPKATISVENSLRYMNAVLMKKKFKKILRAGVAKCVVPFFRKSAMAELHARWQSFGLECANICNANCSFCGYGKGLDERPKAFVDMDTLRKVLDLFEKSGGGDFVFASILGDPLADKGFLEKVKFASRYPSVKGISIYTNLIGLDQFDMGDFLASGITNMAVSTSLGGREVYKRLFGVDRYEDVMENLVKLLKGNLDRGKPIDIKLLVRTDYDIASCLESLNEYKSIKRFLKAGKIRVLARDEWDSYNGAVKLKDLPKGARFKKDMPDKSVPCYALYRKLQILVNGDISVCSCRIHPSLVVDNIRNYSSLGDYWRGEAIARFRQRWKDGEIPVACRSCTHYLPYTHTVEGIMARHAFDWIRGVFKRRG